MSVIDAASTIEPSATLQLYIRERGVDTTRLTILYKLSNIYDSIYIT